MLLLKAFISKFYCVWEKNLQERLKRLENCPRGHKGSHREDWIRPVLHVLPLAFSAGQWSLLGWMISLQAMGLLTESAATNMWLQVSAYDLYPECFCVEALCSPVRKVTMLVLFQYVICWHQYHVLLPASFVCIWRHLDETKHCIQAQTSCCRARVRTSPAPFLGVFWSSADSTEVTKYLSK